MFSKDIIAYTNDTQDYPIGTHKWHFENFMCTDPAQRFRKMNLHNCKENEFSCQNGKCINMKFRCDKDYDCPDFSDEENCTVLTISNYDKNIPPPIVKVNSKKKDLPPSDLLLKEYWTGDPTWQEGTTYDIFKFNPWRAPGKAPVFDSWCAPAHAPARHTLAPRHAPSLG